MRFMGIGRRVLLATTAAALMVMAGPSASWGQQSPPEPGGSGQVVESWALAPAGSGQVDHPGNRPTLSYEVAAGTEVKDAVTLFNYGTVQLNFRLYATDAFNNRDGAFDLLPGDKKPKDAGTWVTLPQENITVPAGKQATIPISLKIPVDARPGDHAGAILASSSALGTGADGKVVTLDRRTGSRMYIRVAGPLAPELAIEKVHTTFKPALNPLDGTADVTYRVANRGNVRLGVRHSVSVGGVFGLFSKRKHLKDVPELLPGESVTMTATFHGVPPTGLAFTNIHADPLPVGNAAGHVSSRSKRGLALAIPLTLLALAAAAWFLLIARRSYRKHAHEQQVLTGFQQS